VKKRIATDAIQKATSSGNGTANLIPQNGAPIKYENGKVMVDVTVYQNPAEIPNMLYNPAANNFSEVRYTAVVVGPLNINGEFVFISRSYALSADGTMLSYKNGVDTTREVDNTLFAKLAGAYVKSHQGKTDKRFDNGIILPDGQIVIISIETPTQAVANMRDASGKPMNVRSVINVTSYFGWQSPIGEAQGEVFYFTLDDKKNIAPLDGRIAIQ